VLSGAGLGWLAAKASAQMPGKDAPAWTAIGGGSLSRPLLMTLAGAGAGLWAAIVHPGPVSEIGALLGAWLMLLAVLDAEYLWLPLPLTAPLVAVGLIVTAAGDPKALVGHAIGAGAGYAALWGLAFLYRRLRRRDGLGGGDAWLAGAAGAWIGWRDLPTVVLIAAGAALAWVAVKAARRKLDAGRPIAFGLYLAIGLWLVWLYRPPAA